MAKRKSSKPNINAIVKDIIESSGVATAKNIEQVLKRIDKLEARISSIKAVSGRRAGTKSGKGQRTITTGPVLDVITKSKQGADLKTIQTKTGLDEIAIRNAVFNLRKAGKIKRKSRGVYESVKD